MPEGKVPRYKLIHCTKCERLIARIDRSKFAGWHVPPEVIMAKTRAHYKKYHPVLFRRSVQKGVASRK